MFDEKNKESFLEKIKTINKQVKLIEKLVNEFSDFARMPKPIFKKNELNKIIKDSINLMKTSDKDIVFNFFSREVHHVKSDIEQLNRVFINLFKNSIESLKEKHEKEGNFQKKIDVEIQLINDYINILVQDNGTGFIKNDLKTLSKPYFTTKKEGSGLGLSIVEKILNDHNGFIEFISQKQGAKIKILLPKYVN